MKNITQIFKRLYFLPLFLLIVTYSSGQNGMIGNGFGTNNWSTVDNFSAGAGSSRVFTTKANATGPNYFRLVRNWSANNTQFGPSGCVDVEWTNSGVVYGMSDCGSGAFFITCPNTTDNYVFKTTNGDVSKDLLYFRVEGAIRTVSAVSQSPLATVANNCGDRTVSATLDGDLATGQSVFLRYTKDAWATSTVVTMTGSATTYTAAIPSAVNLPGTTVSYYVFTSGTTTPSGANADLYTINLNNNSGPNYSYVVTGATTTITDENFEQALIDLGLDCIKDGKVFTSNISSVTELDLANKNISSLVGIKDFTNLEMLQCQNKSDIGNNNLLTALDVSGLTNLKFLYCQDNQIVNLNITGVVNLWELNTSNNPLSVSTLDLTGSPHIYYLVCQNNGFTSLNVSGLTNLDTLVIWDNEISTLDLSNNPKVKYLDCDNNLFTSLNVSNLTLLEQFYCSGNALTTLDLRGINGLVLFNSVDNPDLACIQVDNVTTANNYTTIETWTKPTGTVYSYCDCSKTTTWNGTTWSNGAPTTGDYAVVINGNYSESANVNACSLTVNGNAMVSIPTGTNITLNAPVIVESGSSFTLGNNANLIQTNKYSVNSGNINVSRNSNSLFRSDYTLWSSPVTGAQTLQGFSPLTTTERFYQYNPITDLYNVVVSSNSFSLAKGYLIRMPNQDPSNLGGVSPYVIANASIVFNGLFTGVPNNGDVSLTGLDADKYHAIGNPYPSIISADTFLGANTTDGVLYFWRKTNAVVNNSGSAYASYTTMGGTAASNVAPNNIEPNGKIQVGQGFIVKTGASTTALNFTNAMRELTPTSVPFFKTKKTSDKSRVWLNLTSAAGVFSQALIGYMDGATLGVDAKIDGKYINDSQVALTSNINGEEYSIQGRPAFDPTDEVALNFKVVVGGVYTIVIDHVDGLFDSGQDIYLFDNKTATETNLKLNSYIFTAVSGVDNTRFSLKYQKTLKVNESTFDENSVTIFEANGVLNVNSGVNVISNVKVFDIQGRLLAEQRNVNLNTATVKNLKAKKQVLIVQVTSENGKVVNKKVVN